MATQLFGQNACNSNDLYFKRGSELDWTRKPS